MSGAGGLDVTMEGRLEVLSVLLRFQLFSDTRSEKGGFEAGCRISAGSVRLRILSAEHLELLSACSGTSEPPAPDIPASVCHNHNPHVMILPEYLLIPVFLRRHPKSLFKYPVKI